MTPLQARLNLIGFLCVAGTIAANALYFQDAALFSKKQISSASSEVSKKKTTKPAVVPAGPHLERTGSIPETEPEKPAVSSSEDVSAEVVRAIQRELKSKNYVPGKLDGAAGVLTRAAILAFEYDMGLPLTATPSEAVLQKIIFGVPGERRDPDAEDEMTKTSMEIVKKTQKLLEDLKYYKGRINGRIGKETRKAIREFEADRNLAVTGRVSGRLIRELIKFSDRSVNG